MANVFVRSPYYVSNFDGSGDAAYGILTITIGGQVRYTLRKNYSSINDTVLFEIAELMRDYLDLKYAQTPSLYFTHSQTYSTSLQNYESDGTPLGSPIVQSGFIIDAYGYYEEGSNPTTTRGYMQSNNVIYRLADSDIRIPVDRNNTTSVVYLYQGQITKSVAITSSASYAFEYVSNAAESYDSFKDRVTEAGGTYEDNVCISEFLDENEIFDVDEIRIDTTDGLKIIKVITLEECRYTPIKVSFVNRWGAIQDLWFFKKSVETLNATREQFKRAVINEFGVYDTLVHPKQSYNVKSTKKITINTGYVSEQYNDPMQELIQSEQVWMELDTVITPMVVDANSLTFKTSVNDKLVDYTIDLSYAYDAINNIR